MRPNFSKKSLINLIKFVKNLLLITVSVPISVAVILYIIDVRLEVYQDYTLIEANFPKIKVGMTSAEVEALLGWPDAIYNNAEDPSTRIPTSLISSKLRMHYRYLGIMTDYTKTPINTQGREVWIYEHYDYGSLHSPGIVFDIKTRKVIQITKVFYGE